MPRGISPRTKFIGNYIKSKGLENSTREEQIAAFKEADLAYKAFGTRKPRGRASERARFIGEYIRSLNLKGSTREERNDAFREAAEAWRERRGVSARKHNPFLETLMVGFGQGAGFNMGYQAAKSLLKNPSIREDVIDTDQINYLLRQVDTVKSRRNWNALPSSFKTDAIKVLKTNLRPFFNGKGNNSIRARVALGHATDFDSIVMAIHQLRSVSKNPLNVGELVTLKGNGAYNGKEAEILEHRPGNLLKPDMYKVRILDTGEKFILRGKAVAQYGKNPIMGELVTIKREGAYKGMQGKVIGTEGGFFSPKLRLLLPGGEQVVVPSGSVKSLNPMQVPWAKNHVNYPDVSTLNNPDLEVPWEQNHIQATIPWQLNPLEVPWEQNHIKATMDWNLNPMEIPWEQNHIKATVPWHLNPARKRRKHLRCPVHGNYIHVRKGWRTVTCPIGGERLGIRK